jgi:Sulfotransferase family
VVNPTPDERIHLVADTAGSAAFWQLVGSGDDTTEPVQHIGYDPGANPSLLTERSLLRPVMNPAELELLVGNLRGELISSSDSGDARQRLGRYHGLLDSFVRDWRQFYMLHGEDPAGWKDFESLRDRVRAASRIFGEGIVLGTNRVAAHKVLEGRVLRVCLSADAATAASSNALVPIRDSSPAGRGSLTKPVFIVAAPRSGSTLLFETLAASNQIATLGGEAHWLIETIAELCPGAPGVDSNRLVARQATPQVVDRIESQILERLVDQAGDPLRGGRVLTLLEKTPKNALRIPFLNRIFPDARFIFLWREPRGNISSIMEAWRAGNWKTYPRLEGFALAWSLLLPPGWEAMRGKPLEELAAFQWDVTNRIVLDDLDSLPEERWTMLDYDGFLANPAQSIQSICRFLGIEFDAGLARRLGGPLPQAKHTLTAAEPQKWIRNQAAIERVLPLVEPTWRRIMVLADHSPNR